MDWSFISTPAELKAAEAHTEHFMLHIEDLRIDPPTATRIARISWPRQIGAFRCRIDDTAPLAQAAQLRGLYLEDVQLAPAGVRGLAQLGQLTFLRMVRVRMESEGWVDFLPPGLQELSIDGLPVRDLPIRLAHRLPHLRSLSISNPTDVEPPDFAPLTELTALETLSLVGCPLDDDDLPGLAALQSLREIDLSGTHVGDAVCEGLGKIHTLQKIDLRKTAVTDAACRPLARIVSLRELHLSHTKVTAAGIEPLLSLPHLEYLHLRGTGVGKEIVPILQRNGWEPWVVLDLPNTVLSFRDTARLRYLDISIGQ